MSTYSITSASTDDPNTLIPLLTFILTDKEDRTLSTGTDGKPCRRCQHWAGDNADRGSPLTPTIRYDATSGQRTVQSLC
jgi:hypothetical protein